MATPTTGAPLAMCGWCATNDHDRCVRRQRDIPGWHKQRTCGCTRKPGHCGGDVA